MARKENIKNPKIQAAIEQKLREETLSAQEVLKRLSDQAQADIGDFLNDEHFIDIDLTQAKKDGKTHLIKKIKQNTKTTVMPDGTEIENHFLEIELHDPQKALELLGKYYKLFTQRVEIDDSEWENTILDLIKHELVSFDEVSREFGQSLAENLFESAGVEISA